MKVTAICPCSRPDDLPRLVEIYKAQDYPDKELTILMDVYGEHTHMSIDDRIWQWGTYEKLTVGAKRNELNKYARGEVILHMDSDDFYAPDYITQSVTHLINSKADVTGLSKAYFFQKEPEVAWLYDWQGEQPYVLGSGMCYYKSVWERNRFKDINAGEDRLFLGNAGRIIPHNYLTGFIAFIHGNNTESHKAVKYMKQVSPEFVKNAVGFENVVSL